MLTGLNFTAIDFETANRFRKSACSLGLAVVRDGKIVETRYWLIKPEPFEVDFYNQKVHGISIGMLHDQLNFKEIWPEVETYLMGQVIVAHNASFDMSVLFKMLEHYNIDLSYNYDFCTHLASGWCWPEIRSTKLVDVAKFLDIDLLHHNAKSDAVASARIAIAMASKRNTNDLSKIIAQKHVNTFKEPLDIKKRDSIVGSFRQAKVIDSTNIADVIFSKIEFSKIDWDGKRICLTGTFNKFPDREGFMSYFVSLGAIRQSSINSKTEIAIIGNGAGPTKIKLLKELVFKGANILVLNEGHFERLTLSSESK